MMNRFQRGQALPLGLALALVGMLGALVLYDTGRVATDKARVANAADAAAYSGLLWQARALNYQAYTNRAMVANQVSIAQAVSLRSWTAYGQKTSRNIATVLSVVPPMKVYAEGVATVMQTLNDFLGPVAEAMVGVVHGVNRAIAASQEAMYVSSFAATPEIVATIARESDPRFDVDTAYAVAGLAGNLAEWQAFTDAYDARDRDPMLARTALINESLDDFSRERKWRLFEDFWFYSTPLTRHKIFREGETRLVVTENGGRLHWEWKAVDTLSLQNRIFRFIKSEKKQEVPIGWGAASASSGGSSRASCAGGAFGSGPACATRTANAAAEKRALRSSRTIDHYGGLSPFRSLAAETLELARRTGDPVLRLRTEVALDTSDVATSGTFVDGELLRMDVVAPGDRVSSVSAAEVFYRRPDDAPDAAALSTEGATGYNPYWDVRLAPVSTDERLLAVGLRGRGGTVAPRGARGTAGTVIGVATGAADEETLAGRLATSGTAGTLPDYVGTLAGAWDEAGDAVDLAALDGAIETARELDTAAAGELARIGDQADVIESGFRRTLQSAARDILAGVVGGARQGAEDAAAGVVDSVGGAIDSAQGLYDSAVLGANDAVRDLDAVLDGVTAAADDAIDGAEDAIEPVRDALATAGDTLDDVARGTAGRRLGDLDVAAFEARVAAEVGEARVMAERLDSVRREVARRMHAEEATLTAMTLSHMRRTDFDDPPFGVVPRQFRGYDVPLLLDIARLMATITHEVDPEAPIHGVMMIEASKFFYSEHVNRLRHGTPLTPAEAEGLDEPGATGEPGVVEGEDGEGDPGAGDGEEDTPLPGDWVEGTDTPWVTIFDKGE